MVSDAFTLWGGVLLKSLKKNKLLIGWIIFLETKKNFKLIRLVDKSNS